MNVFAFRKVKDKNEKLEAEVDKYKEMVNRYRYDTNEILYAIQNRAEFNMKDVESKVKDMLNNNGKVVD